MACVAPRSVRNVCTVRCAHQRCALGRPMPGRWVTRKPMAAAALPRPVSVSASQRVTSWSEALRAWLPPLTSIMTPGQRPMSPRSLWPVRVRRSAPGNPLVRAALTTAVSAAVPICLGRLVTAGAPRSEGGFVGGLVGGPGVVCRCGLGLGLGCEAAVVAAGAGHPGGRPGEGRAGLVDLALDDGALLALTGLVGPLDQSAGDDDAHALGEAFGDVLGGLAPYRAAHVQRVAVTEFAGLAVVAAGCGRDGEGCDCGAGGGEAEFG